LLIGLLGLGLLQKFLQNDDNDGQEWGRNR